MLLIKLFWEKLDTKAICINYWAYLLYQDTFVTLPLTVQHFRDLRNAIPGHLSPSVTKSFVFSSTFYFKKYI